MRLALAMFGLPLLAAPPSFTAREAIRAEWNRQPPIFSEAEKNQMRPADRARLELTLRRIGAPGAAPLLPPELDKPTLEIWEAKATAAKTPQERFTALYFLNRLKSPKALLALESLNPGDAKTWPKHLHLEANVATARLNGCELSTAIRSFLDGLEKAGMIDPVRAQAARLRLVMAGKEKELLPLVPSSPGSIFTMIDTAARLPEAQLRTMDSWKGDDFSRPLGLKKFELATFSPSLAANILLRLAETQAKLKQTEKDHPETLLSLARDLARPDLAVAVIPLLTSRPKAEALHLATQVRKSTTNGAVLAALLPAVRGLDAREAGAFRAELLNSHDPVARAAALEDMTEAPADLDALITRLWRVEEYDGVQILLQSLEKWKLPEERRKAILKHFYEHPCWTARLDAWRELSKLEPKAPWPTAPAPSVTDEAILKEATRLATAGKPVRMRLHFAGKRRVTLRLDPVNAPMNVANLVLLARKGFFNGRLVPRVVPDFVVQMGSPCDTMDGGPGYTVRCENSLNWYGPGSVGMALSGKDTGGSQFFITTNATPHLTGKYTRVGEVEDLERALKILDDLELGAKLERVEVLAPEMKP